jgi:rubrerythrin
MGGAGVTTAAIIRFSEQLEDVSSAFYETLAERWPEHEETFLAFARDGKKNKTQVVRTYQETISDAYEASYSFEGLSLQDYEVDTDLRQETSLIEGLESALALEEQACAFYLDVAERSKALLATIPRAFTRVAKKRSKRKSNIEGLLQETKAAS